jgi:hypothetical protein
MLSLTEIHIKRRMHEDGRRSRDISAARISLRLDHKQRRERPRTPQITDRFVMQPLNSLWQIGRSVVRPFSCLEITASKRFPHHSDCPSTFNGDSTTRPEMLTGVMIDLNAYISNACWRWPFRTGPRSPSDSAKSVSRLQFRPMVFELVPSVSLPCNFPRVDPDSGIQSPNLQTSPTCERFDLLSHGCDAIFFSGEARVLKL